MDSTTLKITFLCLLSTAQACSIAATKPVQEMSNTAAALRAAREVQADVLAPELFRQATEYFSQAKRDYQFKNFFEAKLNAKKARIFAEQAETEATINGGNRTSQEPVVPEQLSKPVLPPSSAPGPVSSTGGQFVETLEEQEKVKEQQAIQQQQQQQLQQQQKQPLTPAPDLEKN